ncbi:MAG: XrtA system polysaccharide deacetylase, partial [Candidatus Hodarchaeota archaeon]
SIQHHATRIQAMITNVLTIDVEDYFQPHAFSGAVHQKDWDSFEPRVETNTYRLLDLLDSYNGPRTTHDGHSRKPRATFFILGWIADRFPALVKEIYRRGHEVACHGYAHKCVFDQSRAEFKEDVKRAKAVLEDLTGHVVISYRAPTYSITRKTLWALEILSTLGFHYDSSIYPIKHDIYGLPDGPRFPCLLYFRGKENIEFRELEYDCDASYSIPDSIIEFPLSTVRFAGYNIPVAGGGYFRLLPYSLTSSLLKRINGREHRAFVFYIHPWEIDPDIPKINGAGILSKFRTYVNLNKTENRFKKLLSEFHFSPLSEYFSNTNARLNEDS